MLLMSTLYHRVSKDTVPSFYGDSDHGGGSAPVAGPSSQLRHASRSQCGKFFLLEAIDDDGHFDVRPASLTTTRGAPSSNNVVSTDKLGRG